MAKRVLEVAIIGDADSLKRELRASTAASKKFAKGTAQDAASVERSNRKAGQSSRQLARDTQNMGKRTGALRSQFGGAAKAAAGAAAAYVGVGAAKSAVSTTTELAKVTIGLNKGLGLSVEKASAWAAVAKSRGIEGKALNMAFGTLSKNATMAAKGTGAQAEAFKRLGVSQKTLKSGDFNKIITGAADGMGKLKPGTEKTAMAMKLFGRGWQTVVPILRDGSAGMNEQLALAKKYGATFGGKSVNSMKDFIAKQREAKFATMGLQIAFGTQIAPALTQGIGLITKVVTAFKGLSPAMKGAALGGAGALAAFAAGGPIGLAIAAVAGGAYLIIRNWDKIGPVFQKVKAWVVGAFAQIRPQVGQFGSALKGAMPAIENIGKAFRWVFLNTILPVVRRALPGVITILRGSLNIVTGIVKVFTGIFTGDWRKAWNGVKQIFRGALQAVGGLIRAASAPFRQGAVVAFGGIKSVASTIFGAIRTVVRGAVAFILRRFDAILGGLSSFFSAAAKIPGVGSKFRGVANDIDKARQRIRGTANDLDGINGKRVKIKVDVEAILKGGGKTIPLDDIPKLKGPNGGPSKQVSNLAKGMARDAAGPAIKKNRNVFEGAGMSPFGGPLGKAKGGLGRVESFGHSMGLTTTSGYRPGDDGHHGTNRARDLGGSQGAMLKAARAISSRFGSRLLELIHTPLGYGIKNGRKVAPYAQADHYDHVHVAMQRGGVAKIPGQGNGDKVHVMAEPGEGFLNKSAMKTVGGPEGLARLNAMMPRFAKGGQVKPDPHGSGAQIKAWMLGLWQQIAPHFGKSGAGLPFKRGVHMGANLDLAGYTDDGQLLWPSWLGKGKGKKGKGTLAQLFFHETAHRFQRNKQTPSARLAEGGAEGFARWAMRRTGQQPSESGQLYGGYARSVVKEKGWPWVTKGQFGFQGGGTVGAKASGKKRGIGGAQGIWADMIRKAGARGRKARVIFEAMLRANTVEAGKFGGNPAGGDGGKSAGWFQLTNEKGSVKQRQDPRFSGGWFIRNAMSMYRKGISSHLLAANVERPLESLRGRYGNNSYLAARGLDQKKLGRYMKAFGGKGAVGGEGGGGGGSEKQSAAERRAARKEAAARKKARTPVTGPTRATTPFGILEEEANRLDRDEAKAGGTPRSSDDAAVTQKRDSLLVKQSQAIRSRLALLKSALKGKLKPAARTRLLAERKDLLGQLPAIITSQSDRLKGFRESIENLKTSLTDLATSAAANWRALAEKGIDQRLKDTLAGIDASPLGAQLAAIKGRQSAREDATNTRDRTRAQRRLDMARTGGAGALTLERLQGELDEVDARIAEKSITTQKEAAEAKATAERDGLEAQERALTDSLNRQFGSLLANLSAQKITWGQFVKDVQGILAPLGTTYAPGAGDAPVPVAPGAAALDKTQIQWLKAAANALWSKGKKTGAGWKPILDNLGFDPRTPGGLNFRGYASGGVIGRVGELGPEDLFGDGAGRVLVKPASQSTGRDGALVNIEHMQVGSRQDINKVALKLAWKIANA